MATYTIARLAGPTQVTPGSSNITVLTVPASTKYAWKSMNIRNTRADATTITYTIYHLPSGGSVAAATQLFLNRTITPGELQTIDFNLFVLEAADTIVVNASSTGMYVDFHGAIIT